MQSIDLAEEKARARTHVLPWKGRVLGLFTVVYPEN